MARGRQAIDRSDVAPSTTPSTTRGASTAQMMNDAPGPVRGPQVPDEDPTNVVTRVEGRLDDLAQRFDRSDWIELLAAVILALATIIAAWSAYQATRWGGEQAKAANQALALRTDAAEATTVNAEGAEIDTEFLTAWLVLAAGGDERGMSVMEDRIREEFVPAFEAWRALAPEGEVPPGTPFELPEYEAYAGAARNAAFELNRQADDATVVAARANQTGDNFVLVAVIMASVLFFAGVGSKFKARAVRIAMVTMAAALFLGGLAFMLSLPQSFALG